MFALERISHSHDQRVAALRDISLQAAAGEQIALIGPSGAGKTTLLRVIGAALRPSAGTVRCLEQSPWSLARADLRRLRARIAVAYQSPPLPGRQRVVTTVLAGRAGQWPVWKSLASLIYPADIAGAQAALATLDMQERLFERCDRLSGGQLQRVGIARTLYQNADLVLADEPVSALDPVLAEQTLQVLCTAAHERGATLVASLHAVDLALACFPRIVGVREGAILFDKPAHEVDPALLRALYAGESEQPPTQNQPSAPPAISAVPAPRPSVAAPGCR